MQSYYRAFFCGSCRIRPNPIVLALGLKPSHLADTNQGFRFCVPLVSPLLQFIIVILKYMAKRLIPSLNRVLVEKIIPPSKTNTGVLLPEKTKKVKFPKFSSRLLCLVVVVAFRSSHFRFSVSLPRKPRKRQVKL